MAGNLLPIVLVGGAAFVFMSKKKKRRRPSPFVVLKSDCTENKAIENMGYESVSSQIEEIMLRTGKNLGVEELGKPPGDSHRNSAFVRAWTTAIFKETIDPKCYESMNIDPDYGADQNDFGPDFTGWENWPGKTGEYYGILLENIEIGLELNGYDFGAKTVMVSRDGSEKMSSLERIVSWVKNGR